MLDLEGEDIVIKFLFIYVFSGLEYLRSRLVLDMESGEWKEGSFFLEYLLCVEF